MESFSIAFCLLFSQVYPYHILRDFSKFNYQQTSNPNLILKRLPELYSTKITFNNVGLGYDEDDSGLQSEGLNELLPSSSPLVLTVEDLNSRWIDICIDESRPDDLKAFSLTKIIPLILKDCRNFQIIDSVSQYSNSLADSEIFVTEKELQNIWIRRSNEPMGKILDAFNIKDALLEIVDEEDIELMEHRPSDTHISRFDDGDEPELIITLQVPILRNNR